MRRSLGPHRLSQQSPGAEALERIAVRYGHEPRDGSSACRDDDLAAGRDVVDVAAELIVKLTHPDLHSRPWLM
jgi:hypothetical protein